MITAIIAAYNEERTIKRVVQVLQKVSKISQVIVVNDGSTDDTGQIINNIPGITPLHHPKNLGKGAAIVTGAKHAKYETVLLCDADHTKLQPKAINKLINSYQAMDYDMIIGYRKPQKGYLPLMNPLSGERILTKKCLTPLLPHLKTAGYGVEVILNQRVPNYGYIPLGDIGHQIKHQKLPPLAMAKSFLIEGKDILYAWLTIR